MMAYCIYPIRIGLLIPVFVRIQVLMIYPVFPISFLRIYLYHFLNLFNKCISSPDNVYRCIRAAPYVRIVCLIPNFNQNRRSSTFPCQSHFLHIFILYRVCISVYNRCIKHVYCCIHVLQIPATTFPAVSAGFLSMLYILSGVG